MAIFFHKTNYSISLFISVIISLATIGITQYVSYQQFLITKHKEHEVLSAELANVTDKFRKILNSDIVAARTLALIYKEYGIPENFNSIAKQIIDNSQFAEAIQITKGGVITNIYPYEKYKNTIGLNTLADSVRKEEARKALTKGEVFFAGPRKLREGGIGILAKVPIIINGELNGFSTVLTRINTITKALNSPNNKFSYLLVKCHSIQDSSAFLLSDNKASSKSEWIKKDIPEGDWKLYVAYNENYSSPNYPYPLAITGLLLSFMIGLITYNKLNEPFVLQAIIDKKTRALNERVKELTTIYQVNRLLQNREADIDSLFKQIVLLLPPGWQYPQICEAKIIFDNKVYTTAGYTSSPYKQSADFNVANGLKGEIEVIYIEETPMEDEGPFLKEERNLINSLAELLEIFLKNSFHEKALINSEEKFRSAFQYAAIGMGIVSLDGKWISVNKALGDMLGYREEELMSLRFQQIIHPDDLENDRDNVKKILNGELDYYTRENRYIHKKGTTVWINLNVSLIKDEYQKPLYFVSQIENITERIESQLKFKGLVEQIPIGIYILKDNKFVYVNPSMQLKSGYQYNELINIKIEDFVHEDYLPEVLKNIKARLEGEINEIGYEIKAYNKNRELMWVELFGTTIIYEGETAIIGSMMDITEKKKLNNELVKSEANLRTIFNNTQVSYLLLDKEFNIVDFNPLFEAMYKQQTGFSINDKKGENFKNYMIPESKKRLFPYIKEIIQTQKIIEYEATFLNTGIAKHFFLAVSPVLNNNECIGFCIAVIDITSRKNMEQERERMVADLLERNRELEQFSHILSHNVRAPIATFLGLSSLLGQETTIEYKDKILTGMQEQAIKLDAVVKDLNIILSIKNELLQNKTTVDLKELISGVMVHLEGLISMSHAKITYNFTNEKKLYTIQSYLQSIFLNLILNSIKFSIPGYCPEIVVWTERNNNTVKLYFKDNCEGIDLNRHGDKVFGLYKRFNMEVEGKGMGLFVVKTQVTALNGTIELESEPGKGSIFTISLPIT
jgi:PAS domain S-box-containing protein